MLIKPLVLLGAHGSALSNRRRPHQGARLAAGTVLGIGLGGFIDGILLHPILQWHNMLSSAVVPTDDVGWDGRFLAFTWIMMTVGLALLWRAGQKQDVPGSTRRFVGSLSLGWGLFNVVEGVIDHQILGLHRVHPGANELAWDVGFLAFGALLIALGWTAIRARRRDATPNDIHQPPFPRTQGQTPLRAST